MRPLFFAGALSLITALVVTPLLIRWFQANGIGQPIREDGPQGHITKAGTPTMGGLAIVASAAIGYLGAHLLPRAVFSFGGLAVIVGIVGAGIVGFFDDWLKVSRKQNLGLNKRTKLAGQLAVAGVFCFIAIRYAHVNTVLSFTRQDSLGVDLPTAAWVVLAILMILAASNAVNLTDGLDGLAAGSATFSFSAFVIIGFWQFRHVDDVYHVPQALDLALVAVAMTGACAGFLWWNAAPARIIMGDTGSLAIGAGLAGLALMTHTQLLLPIISGLYVMVTLSVVVQVVAFRLFHRRVFRMAPIHHHFELAGWPEITVIVRFWILAGLATAAAIGVFYYDFILLGVGD